MQGTAGPASDLDLAVDTEAPLDLLTLALLDKDFSESDLPMKVDVIDLNAVSPSFRARVEREGEDIQ